MVWVGKQQVTLSSWARFRVKMPQRCDRLELSRAQLSWREGELSCQVSEWPIQARQRAIVKVMVKPFIMTMTV